MTDHLLANIKAYAAIVGSIVAVLLTLVPAGSTLHSILTVVGVVAAGLITYAAPANRPKRAHRRKV